MITCVIFLYTVFLLAPRQSEQVDLILDEVRLSTTTSVGRLFEWITQHPGPEAAATAAYGVLAVSMLYRIDSGGEWCDYLWLFVDLL